MLVCVLRSRSTYCVDGVLGVVPSPTSPKVEGDDAKRNTQAAPEGDRLRALSFETDSDADSLAATGADVIDPMLPTLLGSAGCRKGEGLGRACRCYTAVAPDARTRLPSFLRCVGRLAVLHGLLEGVRTQTNTEPGFQRHVAFNSNRRLFRRSAGGERKHALQDNLLQKRTSCKGEHGSFKACRLDGGGGSTKYTLQANSCTLSLQADARKFGRGVVGNFGGREPSLARPVMAREISPGAKTGAKKCTRPTSECDRPGPGDS